MWLAGHNSKNKPAKISPASAQPIIKCVECLFVIILQESSWTQLKQIVEYCNELLSINDFRDYCPNGLQVEGKAEVKKLIVGVTASQMFLEQAIKQGADAVLVHHGYFWKGEDSTIVGLKKKSPGLFAE